jgi:hypothetical protein
MGLVGRGEPRSQRHFIPHPGPRLSAFIFGVTRELRRVSFSYSADVGGLLAGAGQTNFSTFTVKGAVNFERCEMVM